MECKKELNHCTCTYTLCNKHGKCCYCVRFHRNRGEIPGCFFTKKGEATFDRSFKKFIEDRS